MTKTPSQHHPPAEYEMLESLFPTPFGTFHRGRDRSDESVVILDISTDFKNDSSQYNALWEEITFARNIHSPSLQAVLDADRASGWVVLETFDYSLSHFLKQGAISRGQARDLLHTMLELLTLFEKHDFVHGDIRPEMLLRRPVLPGGILLTEQPICLGFSPCLQLNGLISTWNRDFKYMAPEIVAPERFSDKNHGKAVSNSTDLYCLGFTLLELLVGPSFNNYYLSADQETSAGWMSWLTDPRTTPVPIDRMVPGIEPDLETILDRMLRKQVEERPRTALEIIELLDRNLTIPISGGLTIQEAANSEPEIVSKIKARKPRKVVEIQREVSAPVRGGNVRQEIEAIVLPPFGSREWWLLILPKPYVAWPFFTFLGLSILYVIAVLSGPILFRLDEIPGVVRVAVASEDGQKTRVVPFDYRGYFRLRGGSYRFLINSGGLRLMDKRLTLTSGGKLMEGDQVFDFERLTHRLTLDYQASDVAVYVNGREVALTRKTIRFLSGNYDIFLIARGKLSNVCHVTVDDDVELSIDDFPWRLPGGSARVTLDFFRTLYGLDLRIWDAYAPQRKKELIEEFHQSLCRENLKTEEIVALQESLREKLRIAFIDIATEIAKDNPEDVNIWSQIATALEPWKNTAIDDWRFYGIRGLCRLRLGEWVAAESDFTTGIDMEPKKGELYAGRALVRIYRDEYVKSLADIEAALKHDPSKQAEYLLNRAQINIHHGEARLDSNPWVVTVRFLESAIDDLNRSLEIDSRQPEAYYYRSRAFRLLRKDAEADADLKLFREMSGRLPAQAGLNVPKT